MLPPGKLEAQVLGNGWVGELMLSPPGSHLQVISGQFLSERSVRTYVEVELFGLPGDPKRRYRTKLSATANSINPIWNEEPFVFEKVEG